MTELDKDLQQIAVSDWDKFVRMIGEDAILTAKICILRQSGNSYGRIKMKLKITKDTVVYRCEKCE